MNERILVPYDGSLHSHCALVEAALRIQRDGATVTLLAIAAEPAPLADLSPELRAQARLDVQRRYEALVGQVRAECPRPSEVHTAVVLGDPVELILDAIEEGDFDLVIMGTHSTGPFYAPDAGRIAGEVKRLSPIPVVLTPAVPWRARASQSVVRPVGGAPLAKRRSGVAHGVTALEHRPGELRLLA